MITITLDISKAAVYGEVAKTTAYTGAKMADDKEAYDRIFTTEEDSKMLDRFWDEAASLATGAMKRFVVEVGGTTSGGVAGYNVVLELSGSYDEILTPSVEKSLFSYFVNSIVGKWDSISNKGDVARYEGEATEALRDVVSKLCYRKKPVRRVINTAGE